MDRFIHARVYPGIDDDLIAWLEGQPVGRRSQAIRDLLREGLRAQATQGELLAALRQAVSEAIAEALAGLQVTAAGQSVALEASEVEEAFGAQLDRLLDRFG